MTSTSLEQPLAKLKRAAEHYRIIKYEILGGMTARPSLNRSGLSGYGY
jgi:hypothetical protein